MKKIYSITMIAVFVLLCAKGMQAQTMQSDLNQVELMKQFLGTWRSESAKDTVFTAEFKSYGNSGMEFYLKAVTQGKIWFEFKEFWGYDKKNDKFIQAGITKDDPNFLLDAIWFTSKNKCEQVPFEYISKPQQATSKVLFELKSPDLVIRNQIVNNKTVTTETYTRVKS